MSEQYSAVMLLLLVMGSEYINAGKCTPFGRHLFVLPDVDTHFDYQ
jgi:hypothetical protein